MYLKYSSLNQHYLISFNGILSKVPSYQGICHLCREEKLAMQYSRKISQKRRQTIVDQDAVKAVFGNNFMKYIIILNLERYCKYDV